MIDNQFLVNMVGMAAIGTGGWFGRELWGAVKELRKDLHDIEIDLPTSYVSKLDMDKRMDHIEDMFKRIYDKLDGKADKS